MRIDPFSRFVQESVVLYKNLGDIDTGGVGLDELISALKNEPGTKISLYTDTTMLPFMFGEDEKLHPVFKEDAMIEKPFCSNIGYNPKRIPKSLFDDCTLDIFIINQTNRQCVAHLFYGFDQLFPEGWEVLDDFMILRNDIPTFIALARKIQHATLTDLFDD